MLQTHAANLQLQKALNEIIKVSEIILNSGVFHPIIDRKNIEYMKDLQTQSYEYQEQLLKHSNMVNVELFNKINIFLINQNRIMKQNIGFFNELFNNPHTNKIAQQLLPILNNSFDYTENAIKEFNILKQATMGQLSGNNVNIIESMQAHIKNIDNGFTNLLNGLLVLKRELENSKQKLNTLIIAANQSSDKPKACWGPNKSGILYKHTAASKQPTKKVAKKSNKKRKPNTD